MPSIRQRFHLSPCSDFRSHFSDRTASTPTETPASPTRTPSTPVPSPTATDAPGTATAPPAVSGSAETDRDALVALYNATNGENWRNNDNWLSDAPLGDWRNNDNWLSDAPLGEWYGVNTDDDGRVKTLAFDGNGLSGEIPAELGSLSNLKQLHLHSNELSGCVPSSLEDQLDSSYDFLGGLPFC